MRFTLKLFASETIGYTTLFWVTAEPYPRRSLAGHRRLEFALRVRRRYCEGGVPSGMLLPFIVWASRLNQEPVVWPLWNPRPEPTEVI